MNDGKYGSGGGFGIGAGDGGDTLDLRESAVNQNRARAGGGMFLL